MATNVVNVLITGNAAGVQTAFRQAGAAATGFGAKSQTALTRFSTKAQATGKKLSTGLTLPIVAVGAVSVKMFMDFESSMSKIEGLVGLSGKAVDRLSDQVLELSGETARAPEELADALYFLTSSGLSANEAMAALEVSAKAAEGGLGDTKVVADAISTVMNVYGQETITAAAATDILVAAVREGKGEPEEFADAIGRVLPGAAAMGVDFEEVAGVLAGFTLTIGDASESTTALRGIFTNFAKPAVAVEEALDAMGTSAQQVRDNIGAGGLQPAMQTLFDLTGQNATAFRALFPNVRAANGALALVGSAAPVVGNAIKGTADNAGALDKAFRTASDTTEHKFQKALNDLRVAAIQLGEQLVPVLTKIANKVSDLVTAFNDLPPAVRNVIVVATVLVAVLGPLAFVIGALVPVVKVLGIALGAVGSAAAGAVVVLGLFGIAVGIALLPIIALGTAVYLLATNIETALGWIRTAVDFLVTKWQEGWQIVGSAIGFAWGIIQGAISGVIDILGELRGIWDSVWGALSGAVQAVVGPIVGAIGGIVGAIDTLKSAINSIPSIPDITPGFDVPGVPLLQHGGPLRGAAIVGEAGPELIVGRGRVYSNRALRSLVGGGVGGRGGAITNIYFVTPTEALRMVEDPSARQQAKRFLDGRS